MALRLHLRGPELKHIRLKRAHSRPCVAIHIREWGGISWSVPLHIVSPYLYSNKTQLKCRSLIASRNVARDFLLQFASKFRCLHRKYSFATTLRHSHCSSCFAEFYLLTLFHFQRHDKMAAVLPAAGGRPSLVHPTSIPHTLICLRILTREHEERIFPQTGFQKRMFVQPDENYMGHVQA